MRNSLRRLVSSLFLAAFIAALFAPSNASAAAEASAWQLLIEPYPTSFTPNTIGNNEHGPGYQVVATNVGGKVTSGTITITNTLPPGVTVAPAGIIAAASGNPPALAMTCGNSAGTITCTTSTPIEPGQKIAVDIRVQVPALAEGILLDEAIVEGGTAPPTTASTETAVSTTHPPFGFSEGSAGAYGSATNADGSTATEAGAHPYQLTIGMNYNDIGPQEPGDTIRTPGGGVRGISGELPQGVVADPAAVPECTEQQLESAVSGCPASTQVGTVQVTLSITGSLNRTFVPLYNMVPSPGQPASFAFEIFEIAYIHLLGRVRSDGDYGLSADVRNIPTKVGVLGAEVTLWGNPTDKNHDAVRGICANNGYGGTRPCPTERLDTAFLTMPSSCTTEPLDTFLRIESWLGEEAQTSYPSTDLNRNPVGIDGCNSLQFEPEIEAKPTTNLADSPSGLDFDLKQPQELKVDGRSTANLKDTMVTLPQGMALNPSAGAGLGGCTPSQLGSNGAEPANCPDSSKIGSVEVKTPLLDNPLEGAVYLATPFDNPFNSLLAIYIAVEDPQTGVVAKLPGKVTADPSTGQLTTTVQESPELPLEDVALHLFKGPRAALTTPATCAEYTTTSTLTPWSTPEGADAHPVDSFETTTSPNGGNCPHNQGEAENHPAFSAGTISPQAGAYSPFVLKLSREDGTQRIAGIDTTLPKGLTGKLAGVAQCPEAGIAQAMARTHNGDGALEKQSPSCPASSEVGTADVAAGSGITPLHVQGHAYLAGPYKGAPLSLVTIVPAIAGPFDLGAVTVRVALQVDPETAKIHAVSDPLPQILDGIPLDLRSVNLELGRPSFTLNPTSCDPSSVLGSATSALGGSAALSSPFQVGGCNTLPFKPNLAISIKGATKRGGHPALKAVATAKPGEANIGRVSVALPPTEFLDQGNIKTICTKVQFSAHSCPAASIYGKATAITPLLDSPLQGPVYLRSSTHKLPDLVVALKGPASQPIEVALAGKVDTFHKGLRNTFEAVPDAPVSKFVLEMQGGPKKGLIENSANICKANNKATVLMDGQNGKAHDTEPVLKTSCGGKGRKGGKKSGGKG